MAQLEAATRFEFDGEGVAGAAETTESASELAGTVTLDGVAGPVVATRGGLGWMGRAHVDAVPDAYGLVAHLVLPEVNTAGSSEPFEGLVIVVRAQSNFFGPGNVRGAVQTYEVRPIRGTASTHASPPNPQPESQPQPPPPASPPPPPPSFQTRAPWSPGS